MRISDWSSDVCSSDLARAAREALERTPDQLKALRDAGVVDAGGRGICVILDAAETAMTGRRPMPTAKRQALPVPLPTNDLPAGGPSYEAMFPLTATHNRTVPLKQTPPRLGAPRVVVQSEER